MKHSISNFNIMDSRVDHFLTDNLPIKADFCYTDPPWGTPNLNYWKTMNMKMNSVSTDQTDQEGLENRVSSLICKHVENYAFIVYGKKETPSLIEKFRSYKEVTDIQSIKKYYSSGGKWRECRVIVVTLNKAPIRDWDILTERNDQKGLYDVCEIMKKDMKTCLELFVGIGYYLKILDSYGFQVVGNELNTSRLQKALGKIRST